MQATMHTVITEAILPLGLFLMNVGMGLSLVKGDFIRVLQAPRPALVGIISILCLVPALGFLCASVFELPPQIAVGLILVATCPGGMFSNLMTDYARGNLALSITLTAVASTAYIFSVPAWTNLALNQFMHGGGAIDLPFVLTLVPLVLFVLLPIGLGMFIRSMAASWAHQNMGRIKNAAAIIVLAIMVYIAATQEPETIAHLPAIVTAVIALNLSSVVLAGVISRFARLSGPDTSSVIIEHAVRQEGTAIYIAVGLLGSHAMALPLLLNSAVGMTIAILVVLVSRRRFRHASLA